MIHVTVALAMIAKILLDAMLWLAAILAIVSVASAVAGAVALLLFRRLRRAVAERFGRD